MIARAFFATLLIGLLIAAALAEGPIGSQTTIVPTLTEPDRTEEDEPGWDCRTMGNRLCGPGSESKTSRR
ncbi:hypothetical protein GCM10010470_55520 [Saccharopolyspora taberi]|uniref:Uncharacterized protein n=1 Tax=Saccharopolyspora taberi TaxID=60895 RepID=A0ABN3VKN3_9PSEU